MALSDPEPAHTVLAHTARSLRTLGDSDLGELRVPYVEFRMRGIGRSFFTTQIDEGTNQVQRIVMARQLLAGVQSQL